MNWIRIAVGIGRDPAVVTMARALGVSVPLTTGCCVLVFAELPTVSRGGDLSHVPDDAIEMWAQWPGKRGKFAAAFRSHLCTPEGVVRSWEKHNGAAIREADAAKERAMKWRQERKANAERTANERRTERVAYASTGRDGTGRTTELHVAGVADATPAPVLVLDPEQPRPPRRKAAPRPAPSWPHFPVALCQDMHALWISRFGAVEYPRFRKAFGPLFTIAEADRPADAPTNAELREALKSYADLAPMGNAARFANVANAAACLAAIARTRRDLADAPDRRSDAVMRIIHGRAPQGAA